VGLEGLGGGLGVGGASGVSGASGGAVVVLSRMTSPMTTTLSLSTLISSLSCVVTRREKSLATKSKAKSRTVPMIMALASITCLPIILSLVRYFLSTAKSRIFKWRRVVFNVLFRGLLNGKC